MKGFRKCKNGHYFREDLNECPYCPGSNHSKNFNKNSANSIDETVVIEPDRIKDDGNQYNKTQPMDRSYNQNESSNNVTIADDQNIKSNKDVKDFTKTYIQDFQDSKESDAEESGNISIQNEPRLARKLVGWLISYTIDDMGVDYRLFEGRNTIGTDAENSLHISSDITISGHHMTILFRGNKFLAKDELSSNGTFINDNELNPDQVIELKDGDIIKIGDTQFVFKTPII